MSDEKVQKAIRYNKWQQSNGRFTDKDVALFVGYFQEREGLTFDLMAGSTETVPAIRAMESELLFERMEEEEESVIVKPFEDWVYPMPILDGIVPDVSSGFGKDGKGNKGRKNHWGSDVMYRRHDDDDGPQELYPRGHKYAGLRRQKSPIYSPAWYCPRDVPIYAVGPGTVWSVNWGANNNVKIDHHNVPGFGPLCTWYQHCYDVLVKKGDEVEAGDVIAIVGAGSSNLNHLHIEWRDYNRGNSRKAVVVDPEPFIENFRKLTL
jgi:murein DD-endopeptidase MepM/ murein hydrolase activator NlpD